MNQGWELTTLGEVCHKITDGSHNPPKGKESGMIMISGRNVTDVGIDLQKVRYISEEEFALENKRTDVKPGDVLLTIVGTIGRTLVFPEDFPKVTFQRSVAVLKPNDILDPFFLSYCFKSPKCQDYFNNNSRGVAQKGIYLKQLKNIQIPIPPLPEQNRIVAKLEQAFTAIDQAKSNVERNLQNANDLFQSELNMIFSQKGDGWVEKKLGDVCYIIGGGTPSKKVEEYYNGSIPWATVRDMNVELLTETEHKITKLGLDKSSANVITAGNVIIATRVGLGKICLLGKDTAINQDLKGIIPKNKKNQINEKFLFWWFKNTSAEIIKAGTGLTVQGVKIPFIQALLFPIVPLSVQNDIVLRLDEINAQKKTLIFSYQQELEFLDELRKSILQKAFNGEL